MRGVWPASGAPAPSTPTKAWRRGCLYSRCSIISSRQEGSGGIASPCARFASATAGGGCGRFNGFGRCGGGSLLLLLGGNLTSRQGGKLFRRVANCRVHGWPLLPLHEILKALAASSRRTRALKACVLKFPLQAPEFRLVNAYEFDHRDALIYAIFQACDNHVRRVFLVLHLDDGNTGLLFHVGNY